MSIAKRPDGRWRARYRDSLGKEHSRHFARKADATRWLDGITSAVVTGTYVDPKGGRLTIEAYAQQWLATKTNIKPSTRYRYEVLLRNQVLPTWGPVRLSAVDYEGVSAWVASMHHLAPATVRQAYRVLSLVLASAVKAGRLARNPADGVELPAARRADKLYLSDAEVAMLAEAAGDDGPVIRLLAQVGLRFGELAALRVGRVDLMRRRIEIAESMTEVNGVAVFGTPKTGRSRSVPLPGSLVADLTAAMAGKAADDFVFTMPKGGHLRLGNWRHRVFDPAVRRAGLDGLTPHDLRHTAASLAIASGANVMAVQRMLGHASAAMTLDVYAGLFEDDLDDLADRMDSRAADFLRTTGTVVDLPITRAAR
ncbi:MAG: site-specific integrase [Sporichthyaceae bacterium]|nr:site-specific integrase [Sporichthyaceae bacterium]